MAPSALVGVFLLAVIPHFVLAVHHTYYVKPTNDTPCPGEPCLTLSQYIQESGKYFISNATMLFLPGEHQLDSTFLVENVASFALEGDTSSLPELSSKIVCNNSTGIFEFRLVQQLDIRSLHFSQCGLNDTFSSSRIQAILVLNTREFYLEACVLESSPSGALHLESITNGSLLNNTFLGNRAMHYGAAIYINSTAVMLTNNSFINNERDMDSLRLDFAPGAIYAVDSSLSFTAISTFFNNSAYEDDGGALQATNTTIVLDGNMTFVNNSAQRGGAISVLSCVLHINGNVSFKGNLATENGGAISIKNAFPENCGYVSKLYLNPNATVSFWKNNANTGGAIFVEDRDRFSYCPEAAKSNYRLDDCFFQVVDQNTSIGFSSKLEFINNSAVESGDAIYGGMIDHCNLIGLPASNSSEVFDMITTLEQPTTTSATSSDPLQICGCVNGYPDCTLKQRSVEVYRGETFAVKDIVAVGQRDGTVPALIISDFRSADGKDRFGTLETVQTSSGKCGDLYYTVFRFESGDYDEHGYCNLYPQGHCPVSNELVFSVQIQTRPCPSGFVLSPTTGGCVCEDRLLAYTDRCNITDQTILRDEGTFWFGYDNASGGLILSPRCPFDYCKSKPVQFKLSDADIQCDYNRSGRVCGSCQPGLSLVLGSNRCLRCSNKYLSLLIVFAVASFTLVLFLLACKLTVASGTINGLVFYANVIYINKSTYFPPGVTNPLTIFIAWLNLDFGIETCFYNGMNAYEKMLFAFPLDVLALVGLIIGGSYYSGKVASIFGRNPIAVLATLFLLSYAKLLRTIIAALSYTYLEYPNKRVPVWLYDGNIGYLSRKHIPLFTAAMVCLIFLFLPYTMLLIFSQWLQAKSHWKIFSCINSRYVKPFLDAYHAPYANKHRYWTGLMLLLRLVLFLISAVNALGDPSVNLLAIVTTVVILLPTILGSRIYSMQSLGLLETSFILNLTILAVATLYIRASGGNQSAVTFISVGIAFATFTGIVIYHSVQQLKGTRLWRRMCPRHNYVRFPPTVVGSESEDPPDRVFIPGCAPTQTVVDVHKLRESCMATD